MLIVKTITQIRRYHFVHTKGIKEICRKLEVSRKTVRKVIRGAPPSTSMCVGVQPMPRLGDYVDHLKDLLEQDRQRPKKRRPTAKRLHELLESEGYLGCYASVQRLTKQWREKKGKEPGNGFIPLSFAPGDVYPSGSLETKKC